MQMHGWPPAWAQAQQQPQPQLQPEVQHHPPPDSYANADPAEHHYAHDRRGHGLVDATGSSPAAEGIVRSGSKRMRMNNYAPASPSHDLSDNAHIYQPMVYPQMHQGWSQAPDTAGGPEGYHPQARTIPHYPGDMHSTSTFLPQHDFVPAGIPPANHTHRPFFDNSFSSPANNPTPLPDHYDWKDAKWDYATSFASNTPIGMFQDSTELYGTDASQHLKLQSLTILDNLASQVILALAKPSISHLDCLAVDNQSDERQAYLTQKELFEQTRRVYCRDTPFIDAYSSQLNTIYSQEVLRKANRATFAAALLEAHDLSLHDLHDHFLDVFVPRGQRLLKWQALIFLELKTQAYISAVLNEQPHVDALLHELFPADLEAQLAARHHEPQNLVASELDFVERARSRKQYLAAEWPATAAQTLPMKYPWEEFVREFAGCVYKNVDYLLSTPNRPASATPTSATADASRRLEASPQTLASDMSYAPYSPAQPQSSKPQSIPPKDPAGKSSSNTTRQPWRAEEEDALLAGLEEVKGPYWSRILSLYGRGGSKSEVLKDRTQIQLKDKARNLKLWHLKTRNEVPACLQGVTGELRKRGGAKVRAQLDGGSTKE